MQDQDGKGVASTFIALDKEGKEVKGYFVENAATLAPAGKYNFILSKARPGFENVKLIYGNDYVFYNNSLGVPFERSFTIHGGNFYDESSACLLPGTKLARVTSKLFNKKATPARLGTIATTSSGPKLVALEDLISPARAPRPPFTLNIYDVRKNEEPTKKNDEETTNQ